MAMRQSEMVSLRMPACIAKRLDKAARRTGQARSALIQRYVDEGLRRDRHPRITFKDGPTGRRAAIVGGPDVWELVSLVEDLEAKGDDAVVDAARWMSLSVDDVRAGLAYAVEFAEEIHERIALNREVAEEAEDRWRAEQELLG